MSFLEIKESESVLFVGEGNFSFSEAVVRNCKVAPGRHLVSTCFEDCPVSELASQNMDRLRQLGVEVMLSVDATRLADRFEAGQFDIVVFMFPHVGGKMKIQKNRALLRDFALSCREVLAPRTGRAVVALCGGQGGSTFDTVRRREADTWQVTRMMACAGLQASRIEPLREGWLGEDYHSFGYRSLDKGFNVGQSVVHVFRQGAERVPEVLEESEAPFVQDKIDSLGGKKVTPASVRVGNLLSELKASLPNLVCLPASFQQLQFSGMQESHPVVPQTSDTLKAPAAQVILCGDFSTEDFGRNPFSLYLACWSLPQDFIAQLEEKYNCTSTSLENVLADLSPLVASQEEAQEDWREAWLERPNLSPPTYSHDLSFWRPRAGDAPSFEQVRRALWEVGGDLVSSLVLLDDSFRRPSDGTSSMTVRVGYRCFRFPVGPELVWKLHHDYLGGRLAKQFGVQLR